MNKNFNKITSKEDMCLQLQLMQAAYKAIDETGRAQAVNEWRHKFRERLIDKACARIDEYPNTSRALVETALSIRRDAYNQTTEDVPTEGYYTEEIVAHFMWLTDEDNAGGFAALVDELETILDDFPGVRNAALKDIARIAEEKIIFEYAKLDLCEEERLLLSLHTALESDVYFGDAPLFIQFMNYGFESITPEYLANLGDAETFACASKVFVDGIPFIDEKKALALKTKLAECIVSRVDKFIAENGITVSPIASALRECMSEIEYGQFFDHISTTDTRSSDTNSIIAYAMTNWLGMCDSTGELEILWKDFRAITSSVPSRCYKIALKAFCAMASRIFRELAVAGHLENDPALKSAILLLLSTI